MTWLDEVILSASGLILLYFSLAWLVPFCQRVVSLFRDLRSKVHRGAGSTSTPGGA